MSSFKKHLKSYQFALNGIWKAFRFEPNMRIHLAAAGLVILLNYLLQVNQVEWLITIILIGLVWMAEIFNTALEKLADRVSMKQDKLIGQAKDLAAGAVLIICLIAIVCALIIYLPYLF